jgi:VanZ family protein
MFVIFSASGDAGSFQHSSRIIAPMVQWLFPRVSPETLHFIIFSLRKCAHLTEYAILAILIVRALRLERNARWSFKTAWLALLIVALYAAGDELHQFFVPHRQASAVDVLIDITGGLAGILLLWLWNRWSTRRVRAI